jgi:AP-2 complex subunit alpha
MGLDLTTSPTSTAVPDLMSAPAAFLAEKGIPRLTVNANVDRWFEKLTYNAEGVLYEDVQIQIGIKSRYHGHLGQIAVYIGNKISAPLTSFTATLHTEDVDALSVSFAKIAPSTITPRTQTQQLVHVECKKAFSKPPILSVSFLAGSHQTIAVRLPIVLTKFIEHVKLGQAEFFERWKLIGGPPREAQSIFPILLNEAGHIDLARHRQVVSGHSMNVLEGIDPNPNNIVAAGILHMATEGKVGCLMRLEPNREAKVGYLLVVICTSSRLTCSVSFVASP